METLEFYGGVNEIGGNKIKLNMDSTSLLLDFGMSFSQTGKYFGGFVKPRNGNGLDDYFELGLLPKIEGIYRKDYLRHKDKQAYEKRAVDGLLLSHAHADHAEYIRFLRKDIPIYMSFISKLILEVLDVVGNESKDILMYKPQYRYYLNTKNKYSKVKKEQGLCKRKLRILKPYKKEKINNLDVQLAPVDHSLPGAAAYLIEGSKNVVYSGDLRFHGRNKKDSCKFVKKAKKFSPDIMICEGTRINIQKECFFNCEEDIEEGAKNLICNHNGLVIVNFTLRDLDRLITFHKVAEKTDRTLLITLKQAYMLNHFEKKLEKKTFPSLNDDHIGVYIPRSGNGVYPFDTFGLFKKEDADNSEWRVSDNETAKLDFRYDWQKTLMYDCNAVNALDVKNNQGEYILRLDNYSFMDLIDIKPENAIYIHSATDPFSDEMELDYEITKNWLKHFNIPRYESFHVSGHARGPQLLEMIREINPEALYPIHTRHVELFDVLKEDGIKVIHPKLKS